MSQPLAAVALTTGSAIPIPCGPAPAVGAVVLYNESPYAVQVRAGSKGGWLPAWTGDAYYTGGDAAWDGTILVQAQAVASNTGQAPSFSILPVIYGSGEPVQGTYPASLTRQVVQGQIVTAVTQVIQDAQTNGQVIVEATPTGKPQQVLITTDGKATLAGVMSAANYGATDQGGGGVAYQWTPTLTTNSYALEVAPTNSGYKALGMLYINDTTGTFGVWNVTDGHWCWEGFGNGNFAPFGAINSLGGQATVGLFGVPVIVAQTPAAGVNVTTTGVQTLFSFTPSSDGLYEVRGTFTQKNGSASNYDFWMSYTDPITGGNPKASLLTSQGGQPLINLAIGASTGTSIPCAPATGFNQGGHAILVQFNDHSGTPNDTVYAQLWRLS